MSTFTRILVPIDGSETSTKALGTALRLASETGARVRLVHCLDEHAYQGEHTGEVLKEALTAAEKVLADGLALANAAGVEADTKLVDFSAQRLGQIIFEATRAFEADLVVVGSHGRRGIARMLLGSGAEQIIRLASAPVLLIRG
jgi:nucleotide-binding universal stress UspA family protein